MKKKPIFIKNTATMGENIIVVIPKPLRDLFKDKRVQVELYDKE